MPPVTNVSHALLDLLYDPRLFIWTALDGMQPLLDLFAAHSLLPLLPQQPLHDLPWHQAQHVIHHCTNMFSLPAREHGSSRAVAVHVCTATWPCRPHVNNFATLAHAGVANLWDRAVTRQAMCRLLLAHKVYCHDYRISTADLYLEQTSRPLTFSLFSMARKTPQPSTLAWMRGSGGTQSAFASALRARLWR